MLPSTSLSSTPNRVAKHLQSGIDVRVPVAQHASAQLPFRFIDVTGGVIGEGRVKQLAEETRQHDGADRHRQYHPGCPHWTHDRSVILHHDRSDKSPAKSFGRRLHFGSCMLETIVSKIADLTVSKVIAKLCGNILA